MALNDADIELLETYLDGELSPEQCECLWRRLVEEADLAAELERSRADRLLRQGAYALMEPSELMVAETQKNILAMKRRRDFFSFASRSLAAVVSAAACILFGLSIGSLGHNHNTAVVPGAAITPGTNAGFVVNVEDNLGHTIATKQFDTLEEAREFAQDVSRSQTRHQNDVPVVPVSDQF